MKHFSRSTYIQHIRELQAGDLVDVSTTLDPFWAAVARVGDCATDDEWEDRCDGECLGVIVFADAEEISPLHVEPSDEVYARLLAEATQDDVDADNEAHAAAAAARFAAHPTGATA